MADPRRTSKGNLRHPLCDILFLMVSAAICGMDNWQSVVLFGHHRLDWLRKFFPYRYGIPSPDTLERFFSALQPTEFSRFFMEWASGCFRPLEGEVISIDGKRIRGSGGKVGQEDAIHMVSAFATANRLSLGQLDVFEKSNEITAIPVLLDLIDTKGCMVSIDAMGCQRDIASKIRSKKSDYLLAVKDNQGELLEQVEKLFSIRTPCDSIRSVDAGHGRVEIRECDVIRKLDFLDTEEPWPDLKTLVRIRSQRYFKKTGETQQQTRYYISSAVHSAETLSANVRSHWGIENNLHWELDVNFGEDAAKRKNRNAVRNFNAILKICLRMVERHSEKLSKKGKMISASLNDNFREQILGYF
jgi:predicted transposase YbfD/YdcC